MPRDNDSVDSIHHDRAGNEEFLAQGRDDSVGMIEFFSGIGGMRCAVESALSTDDEHVRYHLDRRPTQQLRRRRRLRSCAAFEISLHANETYALNFHDTFRENSAQCKAKRTAKSGDCRSGGGFSVRTKLIEQLHPLDIDRSAELWTLSPPCQPFTNTRLARRRDSSDRRCDGLKAVMKLLSEIESKPRWILLENVKGFVGSEMLQLWYDCLKVNGFSWEEYLLSPTQVGIPNSRTRYYMIAERSERFCKNGECSRGDEIQTRVPPSECASFHPEQNNSVVLNAERCTTKDEEVAARPLTHFVHHLGPDEAAPYLLPKESLVCDWSKELPVVTQLDRMTHCFTAAYGRIVHRATGSLLLEDREHPGPIAEHPLDRSDMVQYVGKLRRFTPEEIAALFGFPETFQFPHDLGLQHRYKLIGNAVSVFVVARVAGRLLNGSIYT